MDLPHTALILLVCSLGLMCSLQTADAQSFPFDGDRVVGLAQRNGDD